MDMKLATLWFGAVFVVASSIAHADPILTTETCAGAVTCVTKIQNLDVGGAPFDVTFQQGVASGLSLWSSRADAASAASAIAGAVNAAGFSQFGTVDLSHAQNSVALPWLTGIILLPDTRLWSDVIVDCSSSSCAVTNDSGAIFGYLAGTPRFYARFEEAAGIPVPATLALLGIGLAGVAATRRWKGRW